MQVIMWVFAAVGGLCVGAVLVGTEVQLRKLHNCRVVDVTLRTIDGEPPPSTSSFDVPIALTAMLQWLAIGVILLLACASLALKGT